MQLTTILGPLNDLRYAFFAAIGPTLRTIFRNPSILLRPRDLSRLFFSHVWSLFGDHVDTNGHDSKKELIKDVRGVVLDIGAGHGHTLDYLDPKDVDTYIALEPNVLMHPRIRERATKLGYSEASQPSRTKEHHFIILSQGAEDIAGIKAVLHQHNIDKVDTLISVLTLCSIPFPLITLPALVKNLLKPGGRFLYYEHVLSPRADVAYWQRVWTPIWCRVFDGCRLDVPSHTIIDSVRNEDGSDFWREGRVWGKEDEPEEHLFWHRAGRYVRL